MHRHTLYAVMDLAETGTRFSHVACSSCNQKWTIYEIARAFEDGDEAAMMVSQVRETLNRQSQQMDAETRRAETAEVKLETCRRQLQTATETMQAMRDQYQALEANIETVSATAWEYRDRASKAEDTLAELLKAGADELGGEFANRAAKVEGLLDDAKAKGQRVIGLKAISDEVACALFAARQLAARAAMWHDDSLVLARLQPEREAATDVARAVQALLNSLERADNGAYYIFDGYIPDVQTALATYAEIMGDAAIGFEKDIEANRHFFITANTLLNAAVFLIRNSFQVSDYRVTTGIASLNRLSDAVDEYREAVGAVGIPFPKPLPGPDKALTTS